MAGVPCQQMTKKTKRVTEPGQYGQYILYTVGLSKIIYYNSIAIPGNTGNERNHALMIFIIQLGLSKHMITY